LFCKLIAVEAGFEQALDCILASVLLLPVGRECKNLSHKIYDVVDALAQNVFDLEFGGRFEGGGHLGCPKEHGMDGLAL